MVDRIGPQFALIIASLILPLSLSAPAQDTSLHLEIGIVYYADGGGFRALEKEQISEGGRSEYLARVKGPHAAIRLPLDQPQVFRVCGVDPTRFKLYRFDWGADSRTLTIARINAWTGRSKVVLSESEIPVAIQTSENGCFTLTPKESLREGEFSFSPVESLDAFTFGVGAASPSDGKKTRFSARTNQ
jgi:hypothetical protein